MMPRSIPILLLVALLIGSMGMVLATAIFQTGASATAREQMVLLSEQRVAMSELAQLLRRQLSEMRAAARRYASTGNPAERREHARLLETFRARQELIQPVPDLSASTPSLHDDATLTFLGTLTRAAIAADELSLLREALYAIQMLGDWEADTLAAVEPGHASSEVLLALTDAQREVRGADIAALIDRTQAAVQSRIDEAMDVHKSIVTRVQLQQQVLLTVLGMMMLLSFLVSYFYVGRPLRHLLDAASAIGAGQYDARARSSGVTETANLATTLNWMADSFQADLETRTRAEQRANRMEARLRQISDMSPGVLWEVQQDSDGKIRPTFIGGAFEQLFRVPRESVRRSFGALLNAVHPDDRQMMQARMLEARDADIIDIEYRTERADGEYRWVRTYGHRLQLPDGTVLWNGYSIDIHELHILRERMQAALDAAEAGNRVKSEFLANLSHEIRTPMNSILGLVHLALQTGLTPRQEDYLKRIDTSSRMLLRIINDILDVSKIDSGRLELEHIDFSIEQLLDNVSDVVLVRAQEKDLAFEIDVDSQVPRLLIGDPLRLGQILINLLGNAIKFTERGHVRLCVNAGERNDDRVWLRFDIEDTGIGIAPEAQHSLFEPFTQADASTSRHYGGTGLGLTISRQLAQLMDGDISLRSAPGQGSTFSLNLPMQVDIAQTERMAAMASDLGDLHCLVVDDSRSARRVMISALEHFGFRTAEAVNGDEALARARHTRYDIILMDWRMPGLDGLETAQRLRRLPHCDSRIILVTAYGRDELLQDSAEELDGILLKPISAPVLLDTIASSRMPSATRNSSPGTASRRIPNLEGRHLLLAEDHDISQQLMRELLEATGTRLSVVSDGEEVLACVAQHDIDLVLLDLQMPRLDGYATARAIREELERIELPIIALSADDTAGVEARCHDSGMNDYLLKPVDVELLYAKLADWLNAQPSLQITAPRTDEGHTRLEGVDMEAGLARSSYNRELYERLLRQFVEQFQTAPQDILRALTRQEWNQCRALAHRLRGIAGNLGAARVQALARDIEQAASMQDAGGITHAANALHQVMSELSRNLSQAAPDTTADAPPDLPLLDTAASDELLTLIRSGDAAARKRAREFRAPPGAERMLQTIQAYLADYAYEEAAAELARLREAQA